MIGRLLKCWTSKSANLVKATAVLVEVISESREENINNEKICQIRDLEHEGDNMTHNLFIVLTQTFVTPLDREDISGLASAIDEVLDYTDGTADRFLIFNIKRSTPVYD